MLIFPHAHARSLTPAVLHLSHTTLLPLGPGFHTPPRTFLPALNLPNDFFGITTLTLEGRTVRRVAKVPFGAKIVWPVAWLRGLLGGAGEVEEGEEKVKGSEF